MEAASAEANHLSAVWEKKSVIAYARSLEALSQGKEAAAADAQALRPEEAAEVYSSAVERLGGYGDLPVLEALLRAMDKDGITPSGRLMAHVVAALAAAGELQAALDTYRSVGARLAGDERRRSVLLLLQHLLKAGGGRRSSKAFCSFAAETLQDSACGVGLRCAVAAMARDAGAFEEVLEEVRAAASSLPVAELQFCLEAAAEISDEAATLELLGIVATAAASDVAMLNTAYCTAIKAAASDFALAKHHFDALRLLLERAQPGALPGDLVCKALLESFCQWPLSTPRSTIRLYDDLAQMVGPSEALVEPVAQFWQERDFEESHAELIYATIFRAKSAGMQVRADRLIPTRNRAFGLLAPVAMQGVTLRIPRLRSLLSPSEESVEEKRVQFSSDASGLEARLLLLCAEELAFGEQRNRALLQQLVAQISSEGMRLSKDEFRCLSGILVQVGAWRAFDDLLGVMEEQGQRPGPAEFCEGIKAFQAADALLVGGLPLRLSGEAILSSALNAGEWDASRELLQASPERFEEQALDIVQALLRRPGVCYNTATADVDRLLGLCARMHLKLSADASQEVERFLAEAWARENEWTPTLDAEGEEKKSPFDMALSGRGLRWASLLKENV